MASSQPNDSPDLRAWRIHPSRNPEFRTAVWARIDAARHPSTWSRFARAHAALVGGVLALAIAVGAWTGHSEAEQRANADRSALAATYVHRLDARWLRTP
jgi:hypothetical protein